jgi:hypothetical protein
MIFAPIFILFDFPLWLSGSCWVSYKSWCKSFFWGGVLLVPNPKTEKYSIPDLLDVAVSSSQAIMVA